jgi:uncharacterized SAM-binding protein YcdF (DUF218 family)
MNRKPMKKKNKRLRIFIWAAVILIMLALFVYFFGRFLVVNESPQKTDAIILLSGDEGRLGKSVSLMNAGYAKRLILTRTNGHGSGEISLNSVFEAGVPRSSIIPEYNATSTYTNALYSKDAMLRNGFNSAMVVSSEYHMRRVKYIFNKVYRGTGIKLIYVASQSPHFDPALWWSKDIYIRYTLSEYVKLIGYIIKY